MNRTSEIEIAHERGLVEAGALHDLIAEIAVLEDQVALLEEGLPHAPGMERAALAKEIAAYRAQLDARRQALQQERRTVVPRQWMPQRMPRQAAVPLSGTDLADRVGATASPRYPTRFERSGVREWISG